MTAAIRAGKTGCTTLTRELAKHRTVIDRNRHRTRKAKCASTFPRAGRGGHGHPHRRSRHHHGEHTRLTSRNSRNHDLNGHLADPWNRPSPARHADLQHARNQELPTVIKVENLTLRTKYLNPMALPCGRNQSGRLLICGVSVLASSL